MIKAYTYNSIIPGPKLLILGGVHGDEICGPEAIREAIALIEKEELKIEKGSVTFIPVCNPRAYAEKKRFIEVNLNRHFCPRKNPKAYEHQLMNVLAPYLENCDILLDIHSYRAGGPPFALRGSDTKMQSEEDFASYLGIEHVIYGWRDAYMNSGVELDLEQSANTKDYVRRFGGIGLTLECGQHNDPQSVVCALRGIKGALHYSGVAPQPDIKPERRLILTRLAKVCFKEQQGTFCKPWQHLEKISKGEKLAQMADGSVIKSPFAGRIVFPYEGGPIGDEWMYLGVDESATQRSYWFNVMKRGVISGWQYCRYLCTNVIEGSKNRLRFLTKK